MQPLAIDLFAGLGGWTEALLAEGYYVVGFDIERHEYGAHRYPGQLVIQDVLTLHGAQFKDAALIVASPPCQEYSYMAMPWKLAKAKAAAIRADESGRMLADLNRLFDACFRIQREASEAAGHVVPMIVENVRGAIPWVGRSRWNFGSFHLWGDVPALMPWAMKGAMKGAITGREGCSNFHPENYPTKHEGSKNTGGSWFNIAHNTTSGVSNNPDGRKGIPHRTNGHWTNSAEYGKKVPGFRFDGSGGSFQTAAVNLKDTGRKSRGLSWSNRELKGQDFTRMAGEQAGVKNGNDWFGSGEDCSDQRRCGSKSVGRKAASAMIAKIPYTLARHIAATFREG